MKTNVMSLRLTCGLIIAFGVVFGQEQTPTAVPPIASATGTTVPRLVSYGGVIKDASGKPITGRIPVIFSLYAEQEGGTPLWSETQIIQADAQGRYAVFLGATEPKGLPLDAFTSGAARWLEVQADTSGAAEIPRILLVGVPYALKAADADTLGGKPASAFVTNDAQGSSAPDGAAAASSSAASTTSASQPNSRAVTPATVGGSGTTDFIPLWTSSTALGNSVLFQTGGNVGLGTTSPGAGFDVTKATTLALRGTTSSSSGTGVTGVASASSGNTFGVVGTATSGTGTGVQGNANNSSGGNVGVRGISSSTNGTGVSGLVTAKSGATHGVNGFSSSTSGIGVYGSASATTGNPIGVEGTTASPGGFGVAGIGGSNSGSGNGGTGINGTGGADGGCTASTCFTGGTGVTGTGGTDVQAGTGGTGVFGLGGGSEISGSGGTGVLGQGGSAGSSSGLGGVGVSGIGGPCCSGGVGVEGMGGAAAGAGVWATGFSGSVNGDGIDATSGGNGAYAGSFTGDISVSGNLSVSGTKHFKIDHPLDPANKYLYHASIESSEVMNLYSGNVTLAGDGTAAVQLPEWFETLNRDFRYQLTAIGAPAPGLYIAQKVQTHAFKIAGGQPGMEISWQITGVRQDAWEKAHPMVVEAQKPDRERGYYVNPELFGAPEEKGVEWARNPQMMRRMKAAKEKQASLRQTGQ